MGGVQTVLELVLLVLLTAATLHAIRLYRALGALREERTTLMDAVAGFDSGTRQAEAGLGRLRDAAEQLGSQLGHAAALKDDLVLLSERGEQLADRLDALVRAGRTFEPHATAMGASSVYTSPASSIRPSAAPLAAVRSQAERDLQLALRGQR